MEKAKTRGVGRASHSSRHMKRHTSKTPEGRSATFRVQGLGLVSLFFLFFFLYSGAPNLIFLASIAAGFLATFLIKTQFVEPSRGGGEGEEGERG